MGMDARGWDPFFTPETSLAESEVVFLNYVLNVIEDASERRDTLDKAWQLSSRVLVVSTRLKWELNSAKGTESGDGIVTSRNTFQHFFSPKAILKDVNKSYPRGSPTLFASLRLNRMGLMWFYYLKFRI
jgi:DNA phosphorothioation-associated putative methyltransferase